jgi:predicted nucleotidyltransferase component of viral defense system
MLHTHAVEPGTLALLRQLQSLPELKKFALAGGTALALQYGHRLSIDLDLFSTEAFDRQQIIQLLAKEFKQEFTYSGKETSWAIFSFIQNIKVDFIQFVHPTIHPLQNIDGILMYSAPDIAAMKINAILGRGQKKDFFDLTVLLKEFSIQKLMDFYKIKFPSQTLLISVPEALTYFEDADESPDPVSLNGHSWTYVKEVITKRVNEFLK